MIKNFQLTLIVLILSLGFVACNSDDGSETEKLKENKYVRLLISDGADKTITFVNPLTGEQQVFEAQHAVNNIYPTNSKRFAAIINGANNHVSFFDCGIESHDDHAHIRGTPKWGLTTSKALKPTHFYSLANQIAIFNDGDGSLSLVTEDNLHTQVEANHQVVDKAHHGAVVIFDNGTYAVTEKDNSVSGALPERVKIVNASGQIVNGSTVSTQGIHGDAGNGKTAIFGSVTGMLIVKDDGAQKLVEWPQEIGTENWLSAIYYGKTSGKFLGYKSKFGAYILDPIKESFTKVVTAGNIRSAVFDAAGKDILVLLEDGTVQIYDSNTLSKVQEAKLGVSFGEGALVPNVTATKKYVYVTNPNNSEILQIERNNFNKVNKIAVAGKPAKIVMMGGDLDQEESH